MCVSHSFVFNFVSSMDHSLWKSPGKITGAGSHSFSKGASPPKHLKPRSLIGGGFFTVRANRKPKERILCTKGTINIE